MNLNPLPVILAPLANNAQAGACIELKLADPLYQHILYNYNLPEVREYTRELHRFVTSGQADRDHDLTTARVCQRKSEMVTAVLAYHKKTRKGSPADLREQLAQAQSRIAELEAANRAMTIRITSLTATGN